MSLLDRAQSRLQCELDKNRGLDFGVVSEPGANGLDPAKSNRSSPSGGRRLMKVLKDLGVSTEDSAVDVGCGRGSAIRTMLRLPFARVDGIELSPALASVAESNINKLGLSRRCSIYCLNATDFDGYEHYTHIYMYNPFPKPVVASLAERLMDRSGPHTLIYLNPVGGGEFIRTGWHLKHNYPGLHGNLFSIFIR